MMRSAGSDSKAVDSSRPAVIQVIGCGQIGRSLALKAAVAGCTVYAVDRDPGARARTSAMYRESRRRLRRDSEAHQGQDPLEIGKLTLSGEAAPVRADRIDIVLEALPEEFGVKVEVLNRVVHRSSPPLILTTTSGLSISHIAESLGNVAPWVVGSHFFAPVARMRLVELVRGEATHDDALEAAVRFAQLLGKEPVICRKDTPGFIASRAYAALRAECMRIVEDGLADVDEVDKVLRLGFNFPVGPFELADHQGLDAGLRMLKNLEAAYGPRFHPPRLLEELVSQGRLGRSTGHGFYSYD